MTTDFTPPASWEISPKYKQSLSPNNRRPKTQQAFLLCYLEKGCGSLIVNTQVFGFVAPGVYGVPLDLMHTFVNADPLKPFKLHQTWITEEAELRPYRKCIRRPLRNEILQLKNISFTTEPRIYQLFCAKNREYKPMMNPIIRQINLGCYKRIAVPPLEFDAAEDRNQLLEIIDFTLAHYRKPFSIYELAGAVNQTPLEVCQFFKEQCKRPYVQFLKSLRLEQAKSLMQGYPDKSCAEIALEVGFDNTAQLSRSLKNNLQMSVTAYRKSLQD